MSARHSKMHAALSRLRKQATMPGRHRAERDQQSKPATPVTEQEPCFEALLRAEPGLTKPLRSDQRAEVRQNKPEPVKRYPETTPTSFRNEDKPRSNDFPIEGITPLRRTSGAHGANDSSPDVHAFAHLFTQNNDWTSIPLSESATKHLTDTELFNLAMNSVAAVDTRQRIELDKSRPKPPPIPRKTRDDEQAALHETIEGPISLTDHLDIGDETVFLRHGVPRRVLPELRRGRWAIQAYVDLHGMTREQARSALVAFLNTCLQRGHRCVRIIHGKGLGSPDGFSVLKQLSPRWLVQREEILAFCQAAPHQGGAGALMVLLRAPTPSSQQRA